MLSSRDGHGLDWTKEEEGNVAVDSGGAGRGGGGGTMAEQRQEEARLNFNRKLNEGKSEKKGHHLNFLNLKCL